VLAMQSTFSTPPIEGRSAAASVMCAQGIRLPIGIPNVWRLRPQSGTANDGHNDPQARIGLVLVWPMPR
jgi:hypothetical protein